MKWVPWIIIAVALAIMTLIGVRFARKSNERFYKIAKIIRMISNISSNKEKR